MDAAIVWPDARDAALASSDGVPALLQSWAAARGLRLIAPHEGGAHAIAVDPALATRVEEDLHSARELVAQHDADGVERALARADAILRAHPELPQAAWLLAEVERGWASRFARLEPTDLARAARHWSRAAALDGGRASGVGDPSGAAEASGTFVLEANGASASTELRWDGDLITSGTHASAPGLHQLVAKENGAVVFAQWIAIASSTQVRIALPTPEPCSREELSGTRITCSSWIAARRGEQSGTFIVRTCAGSDCSPELLITKTLTDSTKPIEHRHGFPAWVAWTLAIGGGAAIAAASIAGYYAIPATTVTQFTTGGKPK